MKEKHIAYKITRDATGLVSTVSQFEEERMLDLLIEIRDLHDTGIYWIFKQLDHQPDEALCVVDLSV